MGYMRDATGRRLDTLGVLVGFLPEAYGAKGDGVTDDTSAVQAAFTAAAAFSGGGRVHFAAKYLISSTITVSKRTKISGTGGFDRNVGWDSGLVTASPTLVALKINATGCTLEDFSVVNASGTTPTAGAGIQFAASAAGSGEFSALRGVNVSGFWNNLQFDQGYYYSRTACNVIDWVNYGAWLRNTASNEFDHGDQIIQGCSFVIYETTRTAGPAVRWESGGGLKMTGNKLNCGAQPVNTTGGRYTTGVDIAVADGVSTSVFLIVGNSIEGWTAAGVNAQQAGPSNTGAINKLVFSQNEIAANGGGTAIAVNPAANGYLGNVAVHGNTITNAGTGISFQNVSGFVVGRHQMKVVTSPITLGSGCSDYDVEPAVMTGDSQLVYSNGSESSSGRNVAQHRSLSVGREIPSTTSSSTYSTLWRVAILQYSGGVVDLTVMGNVNGQGAFMIKATRALTRSTAGVTITTIGADVVSGIAVDYLFDVAAVPGEIQFKLKQNTGAVGTDVNGRAVLRMDAMVNSIKKGQ